MLQVVAEARARRRNRTLPDALHVVLCEGSVAGHHRYVEDLRLRDDETVERVAVLQGQLFVGEEAMRS